MGSLDNDGEGGEGEAGHEVVDEGHGVASGDAVRGVVF